MRRIFLVMALVLASSQMFAQLSTLTEPISYKNSAVFSSLNAQLNVAEPSLDKAIAEDQVNDTSFYKPRHFGLVLNVKEDFFAHAQKFSNIDNGELYILKVKVPKAQALMLYSNNFYIPVGAQLHIFNYDHTQSIGAFTSQNNRKDLSFASELIYGDEMYIEYYKPYSVKEQAQIEITELGYAYRDCLKDYADYAEYGSSGSCNVNVNCSEGDSTRKQQRGVMEIVLKLPNDYIGWCTGSLVNNTSRNLKGYVLTALHCIEDITSNTASYMNQFIFYFNFESPGCTASTQPNCRTLTGCTEIMTGESSDCLLLLLNDTVPSSFNTYWNGWNTNTSALTSSGVGIHHPAGDIKKISTYTTTPQVTTYDSYGSGAHIKVNWVQTTNGYGITEGGSSGSPLFNSNGLIIGTLTGGASACNVSASSKYDYYGSMSYHWTTNGTADNQRLKPWLDPLNLGVTQMVGDDHTTYSSLQDVDNSNNINVYPLPAKDYLNVSLQGMAQSATIELLDINSKIVYSAKKNLKDSCCTINTKTLASGVYILRVLSQKGIWTKKVIISK
jgi:hypothetical protein